MSGGKVKPPFSSAMLSIVGVDGFCHASGPQLKEHLPETHQDPVEALLSDRAVTGVLVLRGEAADGKYAGGTMYRRNGDWTEPAEEAEPEKEWKTANPLADRGLSDLERHLLELTADLANGIGRIISEAPHDRPDGVGAVADPDCGRNDWSEGAVLIHRLQNFISAQAAARDHPTELRLMGTSFQAAKE